MNREKFKVLLPSKKSTLQQRLAKKLSQSFKNKRKMRTIEHIVFLFFSVLMCFSGYSQMYRVQSAQPYVDFLKSQDASPVDYIMGLFEHYDVVILGERNHPEYTQYELIGQIISSPQFIKRIGHIMVEVGSNNFTEPLNKVLAAKYQTENQFERELIGLLRECDMQVLWPITNYWQLLKTIHAVNQSVPQSQKLDITLLNPAWDWQQTKLMTPSEFEFADSMADRQNYEIILAENAINALYEIFNGPRKKALIILNVPHHLKACKFWPVTAAACIMARFPNRVANVKINNFIAHDNAGNVQIYPPADGKWDAAFALSKCKAVGFNLAGSPFGQDGFDGYDQRPHIKRDIMYQDMFDGFIFYNSIEKMNNCSGIPGLVDTAFIPELLRRYALRGISPKEMMEATNGDIIKEFNQIRRSAIWESNSEKEIYDSVVWKNTESRIHY